MFVPDRRAFATPSPAFGTVVATRAPPALSANVSAVPMRNTATKITGSDTVPVAIVIARPPRTRARSRLTRIDRRRRSWRSMNAPAGMPMITHGSCWRNTEAAIANGSRVIVVTSSGPAARSAPSPTFVASDAAHSQRKSRPSARGASRSPTPLRIPPAPGVAELSLGTVSSSRPVHAGRRFSAKARKPSCASGVTRWRAMTRAVCHFAAPCDSPRTSRTIALAARAAVGPAASASSTAASIAASSDASPSTSSWTRPIRCARTRIEPATRREQRSRVGLADLGDDERRDDRRQDPEPRLGEPELRARLRDHQVADGAQAHPATERRALDPGDDGDGARVDASRTCRPSPSRPARCPRCRAPSPRASR